MRSVRLASHVLVAATLVVAAASPALAQAVPRAAVTPSGVAAPGAVHRRPARRPVQRRRVRPGVTGREVQDRQRLHARLLHDPLLDGVLRGRRGRHPHPRSGHLPDPQHDLRPVQHDDPLSAGTTLVKTNRTCTKKFKAASSMFMLVPPSLGKRRGGGRRVRRRVQHRDRGGRAGASP